MKFADIKLSHLQGVMDASGKAYPTKKKLKTLLNQLFEYAIMHEIISKERNLSEYINIGEEEQSTKHYRFTYDEVDALWRWSESNEYVQVILMLIYSGVRPGELFNLKTKDVDLEEGYFTIHKGKTVNAARKVPIHNKTFSFFENWAKNKYDDYVIEITYISSNENAKRFYEKMGYATSKNHFTFTTL